MRERRALALVSGGLDSRLAVKVMGSRPVLLRLVHFRTGFESESRRASIHDLLRDPMAPRVRVVDVRSEYLREVVLSPRFGRGRAMNACVDCRIFMLRRARRIARERGCGVLVTGEVVGQRALDQSRDALRRIEREAGVEGRVLRPLCASLLPRADAAWSGWFDIDSFPRLHGSSRRGQFQLARELGMRPTPTPSGDCCLLANRDFALRLRDHLAHREDDGPGAEGIELLRRGRQFRVGWNLKVILGRNEEESVWLSGRAEGRWVCQVADGHGALGLLDGDPGAEELVLAARLAARYSRQRERETVEVLLKRGDQRRRFDVRPATEESLERWRI